MAASYVFQSEHFKNNNKIRQCADRPLSHIKYGDKGEHVALIQEALKQIREQALKGAGLDVPPHINDDPDIKKKLFDTSTRNCIQTYKNDRSIINYAYQDKADPIVGQMTIKWLDEEMAFVEGKKKDDASPSQDFYLEVMGDAALTGRDVSESEGAVFAKGISAVPGYRAKHGDLKAIVFMGGVGTTDPFNSMMNRFNRESSGVKKFGRVCVLGTSVGGRTAMRIANQLVLKGVSLNFIALNDAAFDTDRDPMLQLSISSPATKLSFFQSWSFTIDPSQEFHGNPVGFTPRDMTDQVKDIQRQYEADWFKTTQGTKMKYVAMAHTRCCIGAQPEIISKVRTIFMP